MLNLPPLVMTCENIPQLSARPRRIDEHDWHPASEVGDCSIGSFHVVSPMLRRGEALVCQNARAGYSLLVPIQELDPASAFTWEELLNRGRSLFVLVTRVETRTNDDGQLFVRVTASERVLRAVEHKERRAYEIYRLLAPGGRHWVKPLKPAVRKGSDTPYGLWVQFLDPQVRWTRALLRAGDLLDTEDPVARLNALQSERRFLVTVSRRFEPGERRGLRAAMPRFEVAELPLGEATLMRPLRREGHR